MKIKREYISQNADREDQLAAAEFRCGDLVQEKEELKESPEE